MYVEQSIKTFSGMGFTNIRVLLLLREGEERNGLEGTLAESVTFFFNI